MPSPSIMPERDNSLAEQHFNGDTMVSYIDICPVRFCSSLTSGGFISLMHFFGGIAQQLFSICATTTGATLIRPNEEIKRIVKWQPCMITFT